MGACCSGKENKKGENQEEEIYTKTSRINSLGENIIKQAKATFELEIENSALSKNLFFIIKKISNEEAYKDALKLSKFSLEFLWNVYRFYFDDHSDSEYLIYDYRENNLRQENFLKKFKAVNYKIEQMRSFSNSQFQRFRKYIKDKNIIIIAKEDSIITIEEFIYFVLENKINSKIFLFDYNLAAKNNLTELNKNLLETMDYPNFNKLPFIFLSLRFFPHLKNESLVFLDFVNSDCIKKAGNAEGNSNKFSDPKCNFLLSHKDYSEEDYSESKILNFFKFFKIGASLKLNLGVANNNNNYNDANLNKINSNLNNKNNDLINNNYNNNTKSAISSTNTISNRVKTHNIKTRCIRESAKNSSSISNYQNSSDFAKSYNYNLKFLELNNFNDLSDLTKNKDLLIDYIEMLKMELHSHRSVIIQVPFDIDKELLVAILLYCVWKITDIDPINLTKYLRETLFFIPGLKNFSEEKFEKIFNYLEVNFGLMNKLDKNILLKSSNSFYQSVNNSKSLNKSNKNPSQSATNVINRENEFVGNINSNFGNSEQISRFGEIHRKKPSVGYFGDPAYGNNFKFNNNFEEKSEEEKEKIRQEIVDLHDKVV